MTDIYQSAKEVTPPRTYTVAQLAAILQLRPSTIRTNARSGTWPHLALGPRTIRFTEVHLETILKTSEAPAVNPPSTGRIRRRRP